MKNLSVNELQEFITGNEMIIDTRPTAEFVEGFIKGSINIILNNQFETRTTHFAKEKKCLYIYNNEDKENLIEKLGSKNKDISLHEAKLSEWQKASIPLDLIIDVDSYELNLDLKHDKNAMVFDVRDKENYETEHIVGATNIPVFDIENPIHLSQIEDTMNIYVHCNSGTRSVLACSLLKKQGFHNIRNIQGGMKAVQEFKEIPLKAKK